MSYLARLKKNLDSEKTGNQGTAKTAKSPPDFPKTPTLGTVKTAKSPFGSFGSSEDGHFLKNDDLANALAGREDDAQHQPGEALLVTCWTPAGNPVTVEATSPEHAEQIRRWNPKPPATPARTADFPAVPGPVRCADCRHATPTSNPALIDCGQGVPAPGNCGPCRWWADDPHHCGEFEGAKP